MNEERKPWERMEEEPRRWFIRFEFYRLMGPGRSLNSAFFAFTALKSPKKPKYLPGSWKAAAINWSWPDRAAAWDQHQAMRREAEIEAAQAAVDAQWRELYMREAEVLGRLAEIGRANPADFIIQQPRAIAIKATGDKEDGEGGEEETVWIDSASLNWDALKQKGHLVKKISFTRYGPTVEIKDTSNAIEKLGEHLKLWHQQLPTNLNIDLSQLTDEQLERIANGEDPIAVLATSGPGGA